MFRMVIDSLLIGSAALAAAGLLTKVVPSFEVAGINVTSYAGAGLGAGLALWGLSKI